ncbi:hypothetical protein [Pontibaca salina]|uniref:Uncharacterized protein n=1 Tax=Pontibaca salina TaxID=2795731 RepID=A0A934M4C9_9RHOB|nr:hypothetical protein [Pontibaca salina]MBI6630779.1 hypothetical protein [Pontibaca salina]
MTIPARKSPPNRGGAAVGQLQELPPVELSAVLYLRAWCEGGAHRYGVLQDFRLLMGDEIGQQQFEDFDALMRLCLSTARCPLMRHGLTCRCFGGHESVFAQMIAAAAGQDREDAMMFAATFLTGEAAWQAVQIAEGLGQCFLRSAQHTPDQPRPTHPNLTTQTRH